MSPLAEIQVKARFNGCFSDSLLESSLCRGVNRLQEIRQRAQDKNKEAHVSLGLVSDPRGFNSCASSLCGRVWRGRPAKASF